MLPMCPTSCITFSPPPWTAPLTSIKSIYYSAVCAAAFARHPAPGQQVSKDRPITAVTPPGYPSSTVVLRPMKLGWCNSCLHHLVKASTCIFGVTIFSGNHRLYLPSKVIILWFSLWDTTLPSKYQEESTRSINPDYIAWEQQDQLLLCWLLACLSEANLGHVVGCQTSHAVWTTLELYWPPSHHPISCNFNFNSKTQKKKGVSDIDDYLLKMKNIADKLAVAGEPVGEQKLVLHILGGLGVECKPFCDIDPCPTSIDFSI
ncbi:hypothetical protein CK203_109224 [Vitis vinifera]|uniref:Uncharacterized protein n=1 Tax=Vitis vinifera TaxID=29760 RepID=A0A438C584_VITVI|nr:hypothetical protein CK203_109224 [Vitis vinifera]